MDITLSSTTTSQLFPCTPVFGGNVQDLLSVGALHVNPCAIITVNSITDAVDDSASGVTTLRDAINQANADTGSDLIVFDRSLFSSQQTIRLSLGELNITHNLDIIAPRDSLTGGDLVTVSGNNSSRVFEIGTGATVTLSGLIVADGSVIGDNGGGIKNSGMLTLDSSIVRNNSVNSGSSFSVDGGGIYNTGISTINNSTISGNSATQYGGGIYNSAIGTSTVNNSTINGNSAAISGGGIYNVDTSTVNNSTISNNSAGLGGGIYTLGTSRIDNSTISGNSAGIGGGIYTFSTSRIDNSTISGNSAGIGGGIENLGISTVNNSTISSNSATQYGGGIDNISISTVNNSTISGNSSFSRFGGGGIYTGNNGTSTVNNSTISANSSSSLGGGIYIYNGTSTVNNSTISGNSAISDGGGIYNNFGTSTVNNSTISGNSATNNGGGIYNNYSGTVTLLFSTVTQNIAANGGGVYQNDVQSSSFPPRGSFNVRNTIIASNLNSTDGVNPDVSGTFTSNGYNLIGDSTGSTGFDQTIGDLVGVSDSVIDPRLDTLTFNGGPTQTIPLLTDSSAIGAADPIILDSDPITDQRGFPRRAADGSADIGAFQFS
ncbi:MAG: choice-of-anchor Q domain-containing protein [Rhizonema sp. PD38]|nr:choice-of-anchor Q domain-containing protein [Rhizonema sp. PD38]